MRKLESNLQQAAFKWFRLAYPKYKGVYFAIPNGGARTETTGAILKREGVMAGVADTFLAVAKNNNCKECSCGESYNGLFVEFKIGKNDLQPSQQDFKANVEKQGYKYITIRTIDEFIREIEFYLK